MRIFKTFSAIILFVGSMTVGAMADENTLSEATFAGGCFWCMEHPFDELEGVKSTTSGYTAGFTRNPNYQEVSAGVTGHTEAVRVVFDPERVSYEKLLEVFWRNIDPTTNDRQFVDVGSQYRPGIYYHDDAQKTAAVESRDKLAASGRFDKPIVVEIEPVGEFYDAEEYHQDYYIKNPLRYKYYRWGSGRDQFLEKVWGSKK